MRRAWRGRRFPSCAFPSMSRGARCWCAMLRCIRRPRCMTRCLRGAEAAMRARTRPLAPSPSRARFAPRSRPGALVTNRTAKKSTACTNSRSRRSLMMARLACSGRSRRLMRPTPASRAFPSISAMVSPRIRRTLYASPLMRARFPRRSVCARASFRVRRQRPRPTAPSRSRARGRSLVQARVHSPRSSSMARP